MSGLRGQAAPLPGACALHDVADVVAFVQSTVQRKAADLEPHVQAELAAHLLLEAVRMSGVRHGRYPFGPAPKGIYHPAGGVSFSTWLGWQLPRRVIDWKRKEFGDSRNKTQVKLVPLDAPHDPGDGGDADRRRDPLRRRAPADRATDYRDMADVVDDRDRLRRALEDHRGAA